MDDVAASRLTLHLFGAFEARRGEAPLPRLRTRKGQWLLALLALRPGSELRREWLAGTLWRDSPDAAAPAGSAAARCPATCSGGVRPTSPTFAGR